MSEVNREIRLQYILCLEVLGHSSLREAKLRRHLESNNEKYLNKNHDLLTVKNCMLREVVSIVQLSGKE